MHGNAVGRLVKGREQSDDRRRSDRCRRTCSVQALSLPELQESKTRFMFNSVPLAGVLARQCLLRRPSGIGTGDANAVAVAPRAACELLILVAIRVPLAGQRAQRVERFWIRAAGHDTGQADHVGPLVEPRFPEIHRLAVMHPDRVAPQHPHDVQRDGKIVNVRRMNQRRRRAGPAIASRKCSRPSYPTCILPGRRT